MKGAMMEPPRQSTSGWYASYWNAFLFPIVPVLFPMLTPVSVPCKVNKPSPRKENDPGDKA